MSLGLSLKDFDFQVPEVLVAQAPLAVRHASRLLCLDVQNQSISDASFVELPKILRTRFSTGPILIVANDSRVYPARIRIARKTGARGEVFITNRTPDENGAYECLLRPLKKLNEGEILLSEKNQRPLFQVDQVSPSPRVKLVEGSKQTIDEVLLESGEMPLPPYIVRDPNRVGSQYTTLDAERYQTVYANTLGSQAAPTAGLHFTNEVLSSLTQHDIQFSHVTLHVGLGTFQPVQSEEIANHVMHRESFSIEPSLYQQMESVREKGGHIVFVGTTSFRAVESFYRQAQHTAPSELVGKVLSTELFIWPRTASEKFRPQVGSALITNFHQPQSTLVMLISALLGYDFWRLSYQHAVDAHYRFFSYGDASLILF